MFNFNLPINYSDGVAVISRSGLNMDAHACAGQLIAGIDEAGRGPLLGPVAVAAVILDDNQPIAGLADSKKLSEKKRVSLFDEIINQSLAYSIIFVSARAIDDINILQATLKGMAYALKTLPTMPTQALIDGNHIPRLEDGQSHPICQPVVGGDALHEQISAASILAKVARDAYMMHLHTQFSNYGIDRHKGYPTKLHVQKLSELGVLDEHRRSFKPVAQVVQFLSG